MTNCANFNRILSLKLFPFFLLFGFLLSFNSGYNQISKEIDSLQILLNESPHDTISMKVKVRLCWLYKNINTDTALFYGNDALTKAKSLNNKTIIALGLNNLGAVFQEQGDYNLALSYFEESLRLKKELHLTRKVAGSLNNIGLIYKDLGMYNKALSYYTEAIKINKEIENKNWESINLLNLGILFKLQSKYDMAKDYYLDALNIKKELGDSIGMAKIYTSIGNLYLAQEDYTEALKYYSNADQILTNSDDVRTHAVNILNIGLLKERMGDYDDALIKYIRVLNIFSRLNDKDRVALTMNNIGNLYQRKGKYSDAINYSLKAYNMAESLGAKRVIFESTLSLAKSYSKLGNNKDAYKYLMIHSATKDTLYNEDNSRQLNALNKKYVFEKKELEIKNLNNEKEIQQKEIEKKKIELKRETSLKFAFGIGLSLMFLLVFFIHKGYRNKKKLSIEISHQKDIVDNKNKEITDSITYAKRIQEAILPPISDLNKYLKNAFVLYKPKDIVAGDFYWLEPNGDNILYAAADCTGHGVPGAMVSVVCNNALNRAVREYHLINPNEILNKVRDIVTETFEKSDHEVTDGMDIALCSINFKTNILAFTGANNPLYIVRNGELIETKGDKQSIGSFSGITPYLLHEFNLEKGDSIYIFTDGYPDQFGGVKGKKFKYKQLKEILISVQKHSMKDQQKIIENTFNNWKGKLEQIDDVLMIGVKI
jgi:tetratricopeptide (TPR) repeat protein/serine phosphatase RsbU (regulator of sigma subunit)